MVTESAMQAVEGGGAGRERGGGGGDKEYTSRVPTAIFLPHENV